MSPRLSHSAAAAILAERDPVMAKLVDAAGPMKLAQPFDTHFAALVRSVVYQQLAGKAAAAIHARLVAALGDRVEPEVSAGLRRVGPMQLGRARSWCAATSTWAWGQRRSGRGGSRPWRWPRPARAAHRRGARSRTPTSPTRANRPRRGGGRS